jgi:hypothetical protein
MNVEIAGLTRRFGRTMAVAGADLLAGPGVFGLLGPNSGQAHAGTHGQSDRPPPPARRSLPKTIHEHQT